MITGCTYIHLQLSIETNLGEGGVDPVPVLLGTTAAQLNTTQHNSQLTLVVIESLTCSVTDPDPVR